MEELSESFENLQRRKESEKEVNKKAGEKIFRALLDMLPGVGNLYEVSMSMVDAQREQAIEDAVKLLKEKYGKARIEIIGLIENEQQLQLELEKVCVEVEVIKREYLAIIEASNYYNSIELRTAITSITEIVQKNLENSEIIKDDVQEIKRLMRDFTRKFTENATSIEVKESNVNEQYDDEVLVKMGEQLISRVNDLIEQNEFSSAHSIMDGIISVKGFNERSDELKISILATKGSIYIKQFDEKSAKQIYEQLNYIPLDNKRKWNFIVSYGTLMGDETFVDKALEKLKEFGLSDKELTIKKSTFYLATGNTEGIINLLGDDNGNN